MILSDVLEILSGNKIPENLLDKLCQFEFSEPLLFYFFYFVVVLIVSILLRVFLCWLRAWQDNYDPLPPQNDSEKVKCKATNPNNKGNCKNFWARFKGFSGNNPDLLFPTILGTFELFVYPILMQVDAWRFIGAWLIFKTLPHWGQWEKNRSTYNRFLIGNALTLILSFIIAVILFSLRNDTT